MGIRGIVRAALQPLRAVGHHDDPLHGALRADIAAASLATGIFTIGCLGARFLGGPVTDRLGLVPTAILGFSLTAASSLLYLVAGDIHAVIAIRLCHGLFYGVASTTVTSMASAQVPEERHGEGMGYFMLSVTLASAVGPLVGIALMGSANYAALLLLAAGLAAAGLASTLLCGPTAGQEELGREPEDLESLEPDAPPRWTSPPTACACCPRPRVSRGSSSSLCCP